MTNTFGQHFRLTTFGESHGKAIGGILDGCPAGLTLSENDIQPELDRRKPGQNKFVSPRREKDEIKILSGTFEGVTTGTPIGLLIENNDVRSQDYGEIKNQFRPGHADYTYQTKFGVRDYRGGGRASARETAIRVAGGAIAKKILGLSNVQIYGWVSQIGDIAVPEEECNLPDPNVINANSFFCPHLETVEQWEALLRDIRVKHNSVGAKVRVIARHVPVGLGEPIFAKLDAQIASAMMGIPAVKGVSIGAGFDCVTQFGHESGDEIRSTDDGKIKFLTNNAGGILGGISSGQDIIVDIAIKPTSSIEIPKKTVDIHGNHVNVVTAGRHDPCVGIRAVPVAEAMLALILCDNHLLQKLAKL